MEVWGLTQRIFFFKYFSWIISSTVISYVTVYQQIPLHIYCPQNSFVCLTSKIIAGWFEHVLEWEKDTPRYLFLEHYSTLRPLWKNLGFLVCFETFLSTHWGRVTHICGVGNPTIFGSDNGLPPGRRQAITWTNVRMLLFGPLGTNFSAMSIEIHTFSF